MENPGTKSTVCTFFYPKTSSQWIDLLFLNLKIIGKSVTWYFEYT